MESNDEKTYKVGDRVIVRITDDFKPIGTIVSVWRNRHGSGFYFVKYDDDRYCNNICRFSELTPVNE